MSTRPRSDPGRLRGRGGGAHFRLAGQPADRPGHGGTWPDHRHVTCRIADAGARPGAAATAWVAKHPNDAGVQGEVGLIADEDGPSLVCLPPDLAVMTLRATGVVGLALATSLGR